MLVIAWLVVGIVEVVGTSACHSYGCVTAWSSWVCCLMLTSNFWVALAMLALTGAFDNISMVIRGTVEQLRTADDMRGRVSAVNGVFIGASNQLGGFESGLVADLYSPVVSVVSGGIGTLVVVTLAWVLSPQLRELRTLEGEKK